MTEMGQGQNGEGEMGWGSDCLRSPPPAQEMPWTPGTPPPPLRISLRAPPSPTAGRSL